MKLIILKPLKSFQGSRRRVWKALRGSKQNKESYKNLVDTVLTGVPIKDRPKFSVIVASYNAVATIEETLQSLLNQTYNNFEVIIIDGGSNDGTCEKVSVLGEKLVYFQSQNDKGPADAHNIGLNMVSGDLVTFINADDVKASDCFEMITAAYIKTRGMYDVYSTGFEIYDSEKRSLSVSVQLKNLRLNLKNMLFRHPGFNARFFKREIFDKQNAFVHTFELDGQNLLSCDRLWMAELALKKVKDFVVPMPLHKYLSHPGSATLSGKNWIKTKYESIWLCRQLIETLDLDPAEIKTIQAYAKHSYALVVFMCLCKFQIKEAIKNFVRGCKLYNIGWFLILPSSFVKEITYRLSLKPLFRNVFK